MGFRVWLFIAAATVASTVVFGAAVLVMQPDSPKESSAKVKSDVNMDPDLVELNACIAEFDIAVYRDRESRFRLYGDINRMQEVVDSRCGELITAEMHDSFRGMFRELDAYIAECLREMGVGVEYDPERGLNITDEDIAPEVVDDCIYAAYALHRDPPDGLE